MGNPIRAGIGAAIKIEEKVPTNIPIKRAIEKPYNGTPASHNKQQTVARVVPDVIKVLVSVELIAALIKSLKQLNRLVFINSRTRSATMIESFSE